MFQSFFFIANTVFRFLEGNVRKGIRFYQQYSTKNFVGEFSDFFNLFLYNLEKKLLLMRQKIVYFLFFKVISTILCRIFYTECIKKSTFFTHIRQGAQKEPNFHNKNLYYFLFQNNLTFNILFI